MWQLKGLSLVYDKFRTQQLRWVCVPCSISGHFHNLTNRFQSLYQYFDSFDDQLDEGFDAFDENLYSSLFQVYPQHAFKVI